MKKPRRKLRLRTPANIAADLQRHRESKDPALKLMRTRRAREEARIRKVEDRTLKLASVTEKVAALTDEEVLTALAELGYPNLGGGKAAAARGMLTAKLMEV